MNKRKHPFSHLQIYESSLHKENIPATCHFPWMMHPNFIPLPHKDIARNMSHAEMRMQSPDIPHCFCQASHSLSMLQKRREGEDAFLNCDLTKLSSLVPPGVPATSNAAAKTESSTGAKRRKSDDVPHPLEDRPISKAVDQSRVAPLVPASLPWNAIGLENPNAYPGVMHDLAGHQSDPIMNKFKWNEVNKTLNVGKSQHDLLLACHNDQKPYWNGNAPSMPPPWLALSQVLLRTQLLRNQLNCYSLYLQHCTGQSANFATSLLHSFPMPRLPSKGNEGIMNSREGFHHLANIDHGHKLLKSQSDIKQFNALSSDDGVTLSQAKTLQDNHQVHKPKPLDYITFHDSSTLVSAGKAVKNANTHAHSDIFGQSRMPSRAAVTFPFLLPPAQQRLAGFANNSHLSSGTVETEVPVSFAEGKGGQTEKCHPVSKIETKHDTRSLVNQTKTCFGFNQTDIHCGNSRKDKKVHQCNYCGKLYSRKYGLKIHIRTHTGYKPLKCKVGCR